MSQQNKILLRALPNVEFVHGYPGIPAGPDRAQATIRGAIEVRLGTQAVKAKWVKVELRKVETIPSGSSGEDFIDFVGQSPITVWQAQDEDETLSSKDFPFNIRVPETTPPSVALERGAGIKYEVVATLCTKGKKGLFRREASTTVTHSVPVVVDKHELHSTWPIYAQPESRHVVSDGLTLAVDRTHTCFAPGDRLSILATLKSDNLSPVVLRGFEFSLRETIIYRPGPHSHGKKNGPQVHTSILGEQKVPVSMTLYGGTLHKVELACQVPGNHTTSSVNTGRHVDIGYTLNIKALLDKAKLITMDLPVTITNWPRHVSADMIRRIGTAPNLSLTLAMRSDLPRTSDIRTGQLHGPPRPPPVGNLPDVPNGGGIHTVPPGALVSGPPGSPMHVTSIRSSFSPGSQNPYSVPGQRPPSASIPPNSFNPASLTFQRPGNSSGDKATLVTNDIPPNPHGATDEFGHSRQSSLVSVTAPVGDDLRSASPRTSHFTQDADVRPSVSTPASSTGRRPRANSRPLKIVNAVDDIPEESPVKEAASKPFDDISPSQPRHQNGGSASPPPSMHSSIPQWPTSEEEKSRLYEKAKARAERAQALALANPSASRSATSHSPSPSNGHISPRQASSSSLAQSIPSERPRTVSPTPSKSAWPTSDEEKRRLFEKAQAIARRTQGLAKTQQPPNDSSAQSSHQRTASATSSHDSHTNSALSPYTTTSPPTMSAGAALYSHAIASMTRPASSFSPNTPPVTPPVPRRSVSHSASGRNAPRSTKQYPTAEEEKAAIRYREAMKAVQRRQRVEGQTENVPPEDPIAYEALFPPQNPNAASSSASGGAAPPQLSEKEVIRRAYESQDAIAASNQSPPPAPTLLAESAYIPPPGRTATPPSGSSPPLSEKEVLRRAFEARDAAMIRSGQAPQATNAYSQPAPSPPPPPPPPPPPVQSSSMTGGSQAPDPLTDPIAPSSEKEQMRRAFEARDRALTAQQQAPPLTPSDYDMPPPGSPPLSSSLPSMDKSGADRPLTAAEEKAQLKARYAEEEGGPGAPPIATSISSVPPHGHTDHPSSPAHEHSFRSDSSEGYLRRDPTISAGKKRASQMITPPPPSPPPTPPPLPSSLPPALPPRPPAEYIEETRLEDMKNTMAPSVTLPLDFSASFDLGFGFDQDKASTASTLPSG